MFEKAPIIESIRTARQAFNARYLTLPAARLAQPVAPGGMTYKQVIYHVAWHERQMTGMLRARALVGSPWWNLPTDERNALIQAEADLLADEQVLTYAALAIDELLEALQALPLERLDNPADFADMPPDWLPGDLLAQNTVQHYNEHLKDSE